MPASDEGYLQILSFYFSDASLYDYGLILLKQNIAIFTVHDTRRYLGQCSSKEFCQM